MVKVEIKGMEKLQRELHDAAKALENLDGEITTVNFDPADQATVDKAIRDMERAVDAKVARYRSNQFVKPLVTKAKDHYRRKIRERAAALRK